MKRDDKEFLANERLQERGEEQWLWADVDGLCGDGN